MNTYFDKKTLVVSIYDTEPVYGRFYLGENNNKNLINTMHSTTSGKLLSVYFYTMDWLDKNEEEFIHLIDKGEFDETIYSTFEKLCYYHKETKTFGPAGITNSDAGVSIVFDYLSSIKVIDKIDFKKSANLVYTTQLFLENRMVEYFNHLHELYPDHTMISLKGNIFNNIKFSQRLNKLKWVV